MQRNEIMLAPRAAPVLPEIYANPGLSLAQMGAIGHAWWRRTLSIAGVVLLLGILITAIMPRTYTATATLIVNYEINDPLAGREFPVSLMGSYMSTQVEVLAGPEVLTEVVDRLDLTKNEDYAGGFDGEPAALREWVAGNLRKKLVVEQGKYGSQLIYVTFSASDPKSAADVANTIVEVYTQQLQQRLTKPAGAHAKRYAAELEDLKQKVVKAREQVTSYRQRHNLVDVEAKADIDVAMLDNLEQRLLEAQTARRTAESKLAADPTKGTAVMDSLLVQSLRTTLSNQQTQMAELSSTLGPQHPQIQELKAQMAATRKSLQAEERRYAASAESDLVGTRELEKKLTAAVAAQRSRLLGVRALQDEASKYILELNSAESAYKRALDGYDQVMVASSGQYTNVGFLSRATPPLKPSKPKVLINILASLVLGLGLGIVLPFAYELLNRRVRCSDDLERDHGVPVLAEFGPALPSGSAA